MRVLYISGSCLTKNTSANMSHNSFVKGLLDNGADVDVVMPCDSWGEEDKRLPRWDNVKYFEYESYSFSDKIRNKFSNSGKKERLELKETDTLLEVKENQIAKIKCKIRKLIKAFFYFIFPRDEIYPLEKTWIKNAKKFKSDVQYDIMISNSSPAASHKLASILLDNGRIKTNRWIQIWEDPWYFDLYGGHSERIREEEHYLLEKAQEIVYVSPLTLMYQKRYFQNCACKMRDVPLPFLKNEEKSDQIDDDKISFGYFGDYYSQTRNLIPFYKALKESNFIGYIYGDTDIALASTDKIEVNGRVTLDILSTIQEQTRVLVHLCNLKGGQIPGKIYHYSATNKPILFIVDGSKEEKEILVKHFSKYDRYYFVENDSRKILETMNLIINEKREFSMVEDFEPKNVIRKLIYEK